MRAPGGLIGLSGLPLLIAIFAVMPLTTARAPSQGPTRSQDTPSQVGDSSRIVRAEDFHKGRELVAEVSGRQTSDEALDLRIIIALLPDPDASTMDWMYDAHLAALRRALERTGYLIDRAWFPEPGAPQPELDGSDLSGTGADIWPGVMVFRGAGGLSTDSLVVLYIVGEVPTAGVHRGALHAALREAGELTPGDTLRILGPTFSGSAPSLRAVLSEEIRGDRCSPVHVISGSATSAASRALLSFELPGCRGDGATNYSTRFDATVHTDADYAEVIAENLLEPLGLRVPDVALLTESNTAYGGSVAQGGAGAVRRNRMLDSVMVLTFPLNVASVRGAYDRNPESMDSESRRRRPESRLPLPLDLEERPREAPSARSRLTAPALDIVLGDMVATLKARRIKAVGILASDVRDKLFLAELVRRELPDVLLFTYEGNVLFARRDLAPTLRGMVVASSYPLIMQNVVWTRGESFVPFSTEGAAGVFNAAVHLMGRDSLVQEYRLPGKSDADTLESRVPIWLTTVGSGMLLPLKVTDEGSHEDIPPAEAPFEDWRGSRPRPGLLDGLAVTLGGLLILAGVLVVRKLFTGAREVVNRPRTSGEKKKENRGFRARLKPLSRLGMFPDSGEADGVPRSKEWQVLDWLAMLAAVLSFLSPMALLSGIRAPWGYDSGFLAFVGYGLFMELAIIAVLLAVELVLHLRRDGGGTSTPAGGSPARFLSLLTDTVAHGFSLVLAGLGLLYGAQILWIHHNNPVDYGLYRFRALRLDSGISGLVPLLITAGAVVVLVAWHRNRRTLLWGRDRQSLEALLLNRSESAGTSESPAVLHGIVERIAQIRRSLELRIPMKDLRVAAVAVFLSVAALASVFRGLSFRTLEDVTLGPLVAAPTIVLWLGLFLGFLGIVTTVLHLSAIWSAFREFLQALADTPLAPAFDRIPKRLRTMGRLHIFDATSERLGAVLAEAGHEAVWAEAASLRGERLRDLDLSMDQVDEMTQALRGKDRLEIRGKSLRSLANVLRLAWARQPGLKWSEGAEGAGRPTTSGDPEKSEVWLRRVEDLMAIEGSRYVDWVLCHVRRFALLQIFLLLYITALLQAIPFPHHSAMTTIFMVLVAVSVFTVLGLMLRLAQDDILSRMTETQPGKVNWSGASLMNALVFVALPVIGLLATEVAPFGQAMFGWLQNLLRILSSG